MKKLIQTVCRAVCAALIVSMHCAYSEDAPAAPSAAQEEIRAASQAANSAMQPGPREITLADQAVLKLPGGYSFIPKEPAARYMRAIGNHPGDDFLGLIISEHMGGFVVVQYEKSGYVKDEDAKHWDADELLKSLREGTEEGNKDRAARGIAEMEITGWVEKPSYDAATHRLIWSISSRDKGASAQSEQGINYNTYVLGREGYLTLNLATDLKSVEEEKPQARELLAAVAFNEGKRYQDFNDSTDKVAEYGLAALVGGLAVKKLGLLAMMGAFALKAWKLIALAVVGVGAGIKKFFGNNNGKNGGEDSA